MPIQLVENSVVAGRFKLNRLIGRGGMGSVWQATHLGLDIPCAVKFIEGELSQMAEAQTRFEREAKAAAQLRSPHVVQILDHGVFEGTPYIAMELLDGEDLGKRLQRQGRMHPRELCTIMTQVSRALTKAHSLGIVHRDLKPDNIFLVRDDDREIAKVLDFGIAKHNSTALEGSNTKTGAMLGTPYYMSPEQAQGIKSVDFRSDLWSLAVIVYQCAVGALPFESEALGDLLVKIIVQPMPVPSQAQRDLPPGFDQWWARAASRDPNGRFQSAKEFAEALNMVLGMSQLTDVMDRGQLRAAMGGTPNPSNPAFFSPGAYAGVTPQPGAITAGSVAAGGPNGTGKFAATTGAGMARTSGDYNDPVVLPKKKNGAVIAGVATGVIALAGIAFVALRGHSSEPAASTAAAAQMAPAVTAAPAAPPPVKPADPAPAATAPAASPTPVASASAAQPSSAQPPAAAEPAAEAPRHHASKPSAPANAGAQTNAPAKPAAPKAPASKDLGF